MTDAVFCGGDAAPRPFLDRLDPRTRIVAALALIVAALTLRSPLLLLAWVAAGLGLAALAGLRAKTIAVRLAHAEGFLLVLLALLPLTVPGPPAWSLGPLEFSQPGLDRAALILLRVNMSALTILILLAGLEPVRLGHALAKLGVPNRLTHLFLFAARYLGLIRQEAQRLHDALRARAFRAAPSLATVRALAWFCGQLLVRALERAERIDEAMRCRGFAGRFVLVAEDRPGMTDLAFAVAVAAACAASIALDRLS
jgi:cobalt/nickel transport system permease protein